MDYKRHFLTVMKLSRPLPSKKYRQSKLERKESSRISLQMNDLARKDTAQ